MLTMISAVALKDTQNVSPAISERMNNIQRRLNQLTQNAQNGSTVERKIDQTLQRSVCLYYSELLSLYFTT